MRIYGERFARIFRLAVAAGAAVALAAILFVPARVSADAPDDFGTKLFLHSGWKLQSSCEIKGGGEKISMPGFSTAGWHSTTVPSTVVAALVADKTYPDPFYGENLRSIPGTTYPIGQNFSLLPMPKDSPFHCSWWYRTEFTTPKEYEDHHVWLHFSGLNYRANIWINGQKVAGDKDVAGAYRTFEFDITSYLAKDKPNVLAVETFAQTEKDLGVNWVDWNPAPPDKDMGLWSDVYLDDTGGVAIRNPMVSTHFPDSNSLAVADLTVEAELHNASQFQITGTLTGTIGSIRFRDTYIMKPHEVRVVRFTSDKFPVLRVKNPKLWWPYSMGPQNLHTLTLRFASGNDATDQQSVRFGIREITAAVDPQQHLLFRINGQKILIRGGGWAPDMLLRRSRQRLEDEFRYVRDMNLNTVRLEGKMESDAFYNLADEKGILVMGGWCCCDRWEQWDKWNARDLEIATASLRSQILRMRSHPSMLVWLNGSDNPPPANVEKAYIQILKDSDWPNPYLSSATETMTTVTGVTGVKMTGPYDYVPPDYWLTDTSHRGGAFGFNTETSPGPAIPLLSCLRRFLPAASVNPSDPVWNYHAGSEGFKDLSHFDGAMDAIYGKPANMEDYELKSQAMAYDGERAMFEAYSRNKYNSTGVIQWMLNNAWPSLIWHLYDYYLQPAGGYFGTKKACEPLHIQYSYDDHSVVVVNSAYENVSGLKVIADLYDLHLHPLFTREAKTDVDSDGVKRVFTIPAEAFAPSSPVYFARLELENAEGKIISRNFYWLSQKQNVYDWDKSDYKYTPVSSYEDLTALETLPKASVKVTASQSEDSSGPVVRVSLKNVSKHLAFQVRLGIHKPGAAEEILPVFWDDNYVELMPGESRELVAHFASPEALRGGAVLSVNGWNIPEATEPLSTQHARAIPSAARAARGGS